VPTSETALFPRSRIRSAERHLRLNCEIMNGLIGKHGRCSLTARESDPFRTLVTSIISQQLSSKAADTIEKRVIALAPQLTPSAILRVPVESLRSAGLSNAKARYISELARRVKSRQLRFSKLAECSDQEVMEVLIDLPGIGEWTAEMFLIFGLGRLDIIALGDTGLQRATRLLYGPKANLARVSESWRPYRSIASWYLWRHLDAGNTESDSPPRKLDLVAGQD